MPKRIALLGSTGSIGRQTLDVIDSHPNEFVLVGLAAGRNTGLLAEQVKQFKPKLVSVSDPALAGQIADCQVLSGDRGLVAMATHPEVDLVVVGTSGHAGFRPTLAAIRAGKEVALANKEVLVMAGELVMAEARAFGTLMRPIDSEHSAIWQCLRGESSGAVERLILTASGGPFRQASSSDLERVTARDALKHPNWVMGPKITVDSATLMNKGLEVIECRWLFDIHLDRIDVVVHPQSIIHSMVEYVDGSVKAQLGLPDMRLPIQYAMGFPDRMPTGWPRLDFTKVPPLTFEPPDMDRFPCLRLAYEVGKQGGTYPAVMSAADEVAVDLFLRDAISFSRIYGLIDECLSRHVPAYHPTLDQIEEAAAWATTEARSIAAGQG